MVTVPQDVVYNFCAGVHELVVTASAVPHIFVLQESAEVRLTVLSNDCGVALEHKIIAHAQSKLTGTLFLTATQPCSYTIDVQLLGAAAHVDIACGYIAREHAQVRIISSQHHAVAHTSSSVHTKGIMSGHAQSHYQGTITIDKHAQQVFAQQQNTVLLCSDGARAFAQPTLEVLADDVQCKHGSAFGRIDPHQLYYAQSRGLARSQAQQLLLQGFIADMVNGEHTQELLTTWLSDVAQECYE
jgi:Fe-S cluster assembly protein SufD